jgi:uncharacterized protein (DUF1015 family)
MKIRPFKAAFPDLNYITSSDSFFRGIKEAFPEYVQSGLYEHTDQEAMYIYRISNATRTFTGVVALADMGDYESGRIKRHENTLAEKEQIHLNLLLRNRAIVKPVLLTHQPAQGLDALLQTYTEARPPDFDIHFDGENVHHAFWALTEPAALTELRRIFAEEIRESYIADGHHRSSAMLLLHDKLSGHPDAPIHRGLLSAFFSATEVEVHDFNRIVDVFSEMSPTMFLARLSQVVDIDILDHQAKPAHKHHLTMYLHREWYGLRWKPDVLAANTSPVETLDAQLLNDLILRDIVGVQDVRTDSRIIYAPGIYGLDAFRAEVHKHDHHVGFCLYPVSIAEMMRLSDAGEVLPPKSTWFLPRLKNGILVHQF